MRSEVAHSYSAIKIKTVWYVLKNQQTKHSIQTRCQENALYSNINTILNY